MPEETFEQALARHLAASPSTNMARNREETDAAVSAFLDDVIAAAHKHGLHSAFVVADALYRDGTRDKVFVRAAKTGCSTCAGIATVEGVVRAMDGDPGFAQGFGAKSMHHLMTQIDQSVDVAQAMATKSGGQA
jgi:hypothetical protein